MADFTQVNRPLALGTPLGDDVLLLTQVTGHEELGRLFEFQLSMQSINLNLKFEDIIGKNVSIRLDGGTESGLTRYFNGFVKSFQMLEMNNDIAYYQATVVPWLWFLTQTSDCRIFQKQKAPDIIKKVFQDGGFNDFEDRLSGSFREREFCVQYRETDFNFVSRLMEEEGIYYYFKHEDGKHTLVMADSISGHDPYPSYETIEYREYSAGESGSEFIRSWQCANHFLSTAYAHRDFDFKKPRTDLTCSAEIPRNHAVAGLEIYDYPGEYVKRGDGDNIAKVRIDEIQAGHDLYYGSSDAQGIQSGSLFDLEKHLRSDQNASYLITSVQHTIQGDSYGNESSGEGELYQCTFSAVKKKTQYRAARITAKPLIQGPQTAVVVGPEGEEIHVDEFGRVKVQFHWDRYGAFDDKSSCWVRVSQGSAGKMWGSIFTPRIGQEVIVEFLEGDPDQPIITGRVYNGTETVPYKLPANKTMSTIKTSSSKGGGGFNEIRFEDKKDAEQIFIHGEKDKDVIIEHDSKEFIKNDSHLHVANDQFQLVDNNKHTHVKGDQKEKVVGDDNLSVDGSQYITIKGDGNLEVKGALNTKVDGDNNLNVVGNHNQESGKSISIKGGMNVVIEAGMKLSLKVGGNFVDISPAGVAIKGAIVLINSGGSAGSVTAPQAPEVAEIPTNAKDPKEVEGGKVAEGRKQKAAEHKKTKLGSASVPAVQVMKEAALDGAPFCEECQAAN